MLLVKPPIMRVTRTIFRHPDSENCLIYPIAELEAMILNAPKQIPGRLTTNPLEIHSFLAENLRVVNNNIEADILVLDTSPGRTVQWLVTNIDSIKFTLTFSSHVKQDHTVSKDHIEYVLLSLS